MPSTNVDILLVDDDELVLFIVGKRLQGTEYKLNTCSNAEDALSFLSEHSVGLLLLDLRLPNMNGDELLEKIVNDERIESSTTFICTYAMPHEDICKKIRMLGADIVIKDKILAKQGIESLMHRD